MSVKGIIMFLGMNNTRLERKILIILDLENGFLPTYLPQCKGRAFVLIQVLYMAKNLRIGKHEQAVSSVICHLAVEIEGKEK